MKQDSPWKIGLPFAAGVIIAVASWFFSRQPTALLAAAILVVWGSFWVYGAWRSLRDTAREAGASPFIPPTAGQALVLSRARRGLSPRRGYLMMTADELIWWRGAPPRPLRPADHVPVADLRAWGAPPQTVAALADVEHFTHKAGLIGGDTLTLTTADGRSVGLTLYDPEGFVLILGWFEKGAEG